MKKIRYIFIIVSISIVLLFNNTVFAETTYIDGSILYTIDSAGNITVTKYFGNEDTYTIPMAIGEHFVTKIADGAFTGSNIKKVDLPETIVSIGADAFDNIDNVSIKYFDKNSVEIEKENPIEEKPEIVVPKQDDNPKQDDDPKEDVDPKQDDQPKGEDDKKQDNPTEQGEHGQQDVADDKNVGQQEDAKQEKPKETIVDVIIDFFKGLTGNKDEVEINNVIENNSNTIVGNESEIIEEDIDPFAEENNVSNNLDNSKMMDVGTEVSTSSQEKISTVVYILITVLVVIGVVFVIKRKKTINDNKK